MSVQSVTRAINLLKTLAVSPDGLGVTELALQTDIHKSTVFRLLNTLELAEVVCRTQSGRRYAVASEFSAMFNQYNRVTNLLTVVRPYLAQLSAFAGEDAGLALLDSDKAHFVDQVVQDDQQAVQVRNWIDTQIPLHEVAAGRAMLAFQSSSVRDSIWSVISVWFRPNPHPSRSCLQQSNLKGTSGSLMPTIQD